MSNARHEKMSSAEYHSPEMSRVSVSHSELECFMESEALYEGRYLRGIFPKKVTPAMQWGLDMHRIFIDGERWTKIPPEVLTKSGLKGKDYDIWAASVIDTALGGGLFLSADEDDAVLQMGRNICQHPHANELMVATRKREFTILWTDDVTGLNLRARLDLLSDWNGGVIADMKNTSAVTPKAFSRQAENLGWYRQAAFYQEAVCELTGDLLPVVFIPISSTPPYSVETFAVPSEDISRASAQNRDALNRMADCKASGKWVSRTHGQIVEVAAPRWAAFDNEYQLES